MTTDYKQKIADLIFKSASIHILKKAVFSKPSDKTIIKAVSTLKEIGGRLALQTEFFHKDNKATHQNIYFDSDNVYEYLLSLASEFSQINLITTVGDCEYRRSSSGNETVIGANKLQNALKSDITDKEEISIDGNNKIKNHNPWRSTTSGFSSQCFVRGFRECRHCADSRCRPPACVGNCDSECR